MPDGCIGSCLLCGKCAAGGNFPILDKFKMDLVYKHSKGGHAVAIDLGTSTVVIALLDLSKGTIVSRHSFYNPQKIYGADVISRIQAANNGHLQELRRLITGSIAKGIDTLLQAADVKHIGEIVIAGNTTMIHLLLGLPCENLGVSPFKPKHILKNHYAYDEIFFLNDSSVTIRIISWFTAFVGGDITAGLLFLLHTNELKRKKRFMLIDLGTNGEIALYDEGKLTVTSAAAGPAFEGAGGAAGVIKDLAGLIRNEKIDETGLLKEKTAFTQKEIRDLQLAKSAIRSGLEILLEENGLGYHSLENLFLSGGIGQAIDADDAAEIGLIPDELKNITQAIGNSSLAGAVCFLFYKENSLKIIQGLFINFKEINLAKHPRFCEMFAENMRF